jgi:hypothetical protein
MARLGMVLAWAWSVLPVGCLYLAWLSAWFIIGHRPRPMIDNPHQINVLVTALSALAILSGTSFPVGLGAGIFLTIWWVHDQRGSTRMATFLILLLFACHIASLALIIADPVHVLEWLLD